MSEIIIHDVRLTFLWAETLPELLAGDDPAPGPLGFVRDEIAYGERFAKILQRQPKSQYPANLEAPWPRPSGDFFWTYYLEGAVPGEIEAEKAWRFLIPFRQKLPIVATAPWLAGGRLSLEGFLFPSGVALALSVRIQAALPLAKAVEEAHKLRRTGRLEIQWADRTRESLGLDELGRKGLDVLRRAVLATNAAGTQPGLFSIVTIVQAEGADPKAATPEGEAVHQALQALTSWSPTWLDDQLVKLADTRLPIRAISPASHVLHAGKRGRAVWFPGLYGPATGKLRSISCYHRNLFFTTLQVEALAGLAAATDLELRRDQEIATVKQRGLAQRAVGILGRLYGAAAKTYRSQSPRAQMDQNLYVEPINRVRAYFAMKPLQ